MGIELKPCPLCGSTDIACFAEYDGDSYDNEPIYRAVVGCRGCRETGCDESYDEEPCFGIEAYFPDSHPLLALADEMDHTDSEVGWTDDALPHFARRIRQELGVSDNA